MKSFKNKERYKSKEALCYKDNRLIYKTVKLASPIHSRDLKKGRKLLDRQCSIALTHLTRF